MVEALVVTLAVLAGTPDALANAPHFPDVFFVNPHFRGHDKGDVMIEDICMSKRVVADLRHGPLAPFLDQFGERIERSHDRQSARRILHAYIPAKMECQARGNDPALAIEQRLAGHVDVIHTGRPLIAED